MRVRLAFALSLCGVFVLIGQAFDRSVRERQFFELSLAEQRESIAKGLATKWEDYLLDLAREGRLPKSYSLHWNRSGETLLTPFFPEGRSQVIELPWPDYRKNVAAANLDGQKAFLHVAFNRPRSWDRILAIQEWALRFGALPEDLEPSGYEQAIVDAEAREAYARIFQLFESGRDFTFTRREVDFDRAFFSVTDDSKIESFVPSVRELKATALPQFLKQNGVSAARLGQHPWDIRFDVVQEFEPPSSWLSNTIAAFALGLIAAGVVLYWTSLRDQKAALLRRVTFLNQVVHELKTPLAGLKLHVQLIKRSGPTEATLGAINESVGRIDRLFDDIVMINRPSKPAELEELEPEWLNQWARSWSDEYAGKVEVKGAFHRTICSDKKRLSLLMRNLLGNAVKYGERATVSISESDEGTEISVQDEGPGISATDAKLIFEEFYRSEAGRRKSADGLGLGLSLVKKLAEELPARVSLANPGEPRAKFVVNLPGPSVAHRKDKT